MHISTYNHVASDVQVYEQEYFLITFNTTLSRQRYLNQQLKISKKNRFVNDHGIQNMNTHEK